MRALVNLDRMKMSERVEGALKKLGFSYLKNQGHTVTEFVVQSPCHLNVTIENLTREQIGFPLRSRVKVESAVELRRANRGQGAGIGAQALRRSPCPGASTGAS